MTNAGGIAGRPSLPTFDVPLHALLKRLGSGAEAAASYETLRFRLVTFFRLRFPADSEALADEALDRLARRLAEGTQIANVGSYALGIARFLILETSAHRRKEQDAARESMYALHIEREEMDPDPALCALKTCLESVGAEAATLITEYYGAEAGAAKIARRQTLARQMGLSVNALRNRALRIRISLEKCVQAQLVATSAQPAQPGAVVGAALCEPSQSGACPVCLQVQK